MLSYDKKNQSLLVFYREKFFFKRYLNFFLIALFVNILSFNAIAEPISEAQVKAAFVYNFAKFTEWPSSVFATPQTPILLCLINSKNNSANAFSTLEGRPVQGHAVQIKNVTRIEELKSCHLLYIADADEKYLTDVFRAVGSLPVLTISDLDGFAESGGIIGLIVVNSGIQFEINLESARRANLNLSAQLLKLSKNIHDSKGKRP